MAKQEIIRMTPAEVLRNIPDRDLFNPPKGGGRLPRWYRDLVRAEKRRRYPGTVR